MIQKYVKTLTFAKENELVSCVFLVGESARLLGHRLGGFLFRVPVDHVQGQGVWTEEEVVLVRYWDQAVHF